MIKPWNPPTLAAGGMGLRWEVETLPFSLLPHQNPAPQAFVLEDEDLAQHGVDTLTGRIVSGIQPIRRDGTGSELGTPLHNPPAPEPVPEPAPEPAPNRAREPRSGTRSATRCETRSEPLRSAP